MPRTIRFHLDEHVDDAVAEGLRRRGIHVTTTVEAGLSGADDTDHLAFGLAEGRVVFTNDGDFRRINSRTRDHAGIAYCQQQSRTIGQIIRGLELIWELLEPGDMRGKVEFL